MSWMEITAGPAGTLVGGVAGALVTQVSYWLLMHRRARARMADDAAQLAQVRLGIDENANERLYRNIDERLKWCEQRYAECERIKRELDVRVIFLEGTVIRVTAALDIMRSSYIAAGLKEPPLPDLRPPSDGLVLGAIRGSGQREA